MKETINSYNFPGVYSSLGIDTSNLGCVMLWLGSVPVPDEVRQFAYKSQDPSKWWVDGIVADNAHLTLLYGLLRNYPYFTHVQTVLDGWLPGEIRITGIESFGNPKDEFDCLVGVVETTDALLEGHYRLQLLPHINTYANEFRPHVTLAYVNQKYSSASKTLLKGVVGSVFSKGTLVVS